MSETAIPPILPGRTGLSLPREHISPWLAVPADERIDISFTRNDWDDLLLGVIANQTAIAALRNSIIGLLSGDKTAAVERLNEATESIDSSTSRLSMLLETIMSQAVIKRHG